MWGASKSTGRSIDHPGGVAKRSTKKKGRRHEAGVAGIQHSGRYDY